MHTRSVFLKKRARCSILGHLTTVVTANALYLAISYMLPGLFSGIFSGGGIAGFLFREINVWLIAVFTGIFEYGLCGIYLSLQYGQAARISDLLAGFKENTDSIIRVMAFVEGLQVLLLLPGNLSYSLMLGGSCPGWLVAIAYVFGITGSLYISLTYAMALYLLLDFPGLSGITALSRSRKLMTGHRLFLLYVYLTFLPMAVLGIVTLGVGGLWVMSYRLAARAGLYRELMEERRKKAIESPEQ